MLDTIGRLPRTWEQGTSLKQQLKDKLIEHEQYIDKYGEDLPEIRNRKWASREVAQELMDAKMKDYWPRNKSLSWALRRPAVPQCSFFHQHKKHGHQN